ncbi:plasmid partitioning protein, partial [bacterium]|nr:plasmid partitioning protein [bacterium]
QNQILSVVQGRKDSTVPIERARQLVRHMKTMYLRFVPGLQKTTISIESLPGYNPRGEGFLWSDHKGARISFIIPENLGHAWPAGYGKGDTKTFIDPESINYPAYVTQFFFDNNRRMKKTP